MSDCEVVMQKLEDLLHDELCSEESQTIRDHIAQCSHCRAEQHVCETLTEAIQRACREKAPDQLRESILTKLQGS